MSDFPNLKGSIKRASRFIPAPVQIYEWPYTDDDGQPILDENGNVQCTYWVRNMTLKERSAFEAAASKIDEHGETSLDVSKVRVQLLLRTLCDESGQRLFADEEVAELEGLPADGAVKAFVAAQKATGMDGSAKK